MSVARPEKQNSGSTSFPHCTYPLHPRARALVTGRLQGTLLVGFLESWRRLIAGLFLVCYPLQMLLNGLIEVSCLLPTPNNPLPPQLLLSMFQDFVPVHTLTPPLPLPFGERPPVLPPSPSGQSRRLVLSLRFGLGTWTFARASRDRSTVELGSAKLAPRLAGRQLRVRRGHDACNDLPAELVTLASVLVVNFCFVCSHASIHSAAKATPRIFHPEPCWACTRHAAKTTRDKRKSQQLLSVNWALMPAS